MCLSPPFSAWNTENGKTKRQERGIECGEGKGGGEQKVINTLPPDNLRVLTKAAYTFVDNMQVCGVHKFSVVRVTSLI